MHVFFKELVELFETFIELVTKFIQQLEVIIGYFDDQLVFLDLALLIDVHCPVSELELEVASVEVREVVRSDDLSFPYLIELVLL